MKFVRLLIVLAATLSVARGGDWYVDPLLGDDANSGTTQADPWRTVTHALAVVPAKGDVIHLAPGVYDATSGEVYPLPIRTGTRVVGDGGSEVTLLDGGWFQGAGEAPFYHLQLEGVSLRDGHTGVDVYLWHEYDVELDLVDVQILDMSLHGIQVDAYTPWTGYGAHTNADLDRVLIRGCAGSGARISASAESGTAHVDVDARGCDFSDCGGLGFYAGAGSTDCCSDAQARLERCRATGNGAGGAQVSTNAYFGGGVLSLHDCLVAANGGDGVSMIYGGVENSTIADNLGIGVSGGTFVMGSILHGNGDDLAGFAGAFDYSLTNDPDAPAGTGNLTGDPLFTDPANGDYRLRFGSPCVDAGDPAAPAGADVEGLPRPLDGDLDAAPRHDMGAHELAPLSTNGVPALGDTVDLELWGPAGGSAVLFWRRGLVDLEIPTIYGVWYLGRPRTFWAQSATAPWPPATVGYLVPNDPSLVGLSVSFQALSTSGFGTLAFTNPVTLTFVE